MRTLYLRNVPAVVVERLERLAAREGLSVSALAVRELSAISRRADNSSLLDELPDLDVDPATIVKSVHSGRPAR